MIGTVSGVDPTRLTMSLATAWRHRRSEAEEVAAQEIASFLEAAALAWLERFCGIKVESATFLLHPILHLFTEPYSPIKNSGVDEIFCRCHQFLSNFKCKGGPPRLV